MQELERCAWCAGDSLYLDYHDKEWGVPLFDDDRLFEFLLLEGAQAGLSWITVLRKRENYRSAMDNFNAEKIASYGATKKQQLLGDSGIIRNRLKIDSAVKNANAFLDFRDREHSFADFLWSFVNHKPVQNDFRQSNDVPATTEVSERMSKSLKKLGFNFIGGTICYALMQATGMVNDHLVSCYRWQECRDITT